nr:MAG TPA: hypothetical protein [Caudoviricetes sp.]
MIYSENIETERWRAIVSLRARPVSSVILIRNHENA